MSDGVDRRKETLEVLEDGLTGFASWVKAAREKGNVAFKKGDNEEAYRVYWACVYEAEIYNESLDADHLSEGGKNQLQLIFLNLAQASLKTWRLRDAAWAAKRSLELDYMSVKGWYRLGLACMHLSHYGTAAEAFVEVLQLDPSNAEARRHLRLCQVSRKSDKTERFEHSFTGALSKLLAAKSKLKTTTAQNMLESLLHQAQEKALVRPSVEARESRERQKGEGESEVVGDVVEEGEDFEIWTDETVEMFTSGLISEVILDPQETAEAPGPAWGLLPMAMKLFGDLDVRPFLDVLETYRENMDRYPDVFGLWMSADPGAKKYTDPEKVREENKLMPLPFHPYAVVRRIRGVRMGMARPWHNKWLPVLCEKRGLDPKKYCADNRTAWKQARYRSMFLVSCLNPVEVPTGRRGDVTSVYENFEEFIAEGFDNAALSLAAETMCVEEVRKKDIERRKKEGEEVEDSDDPGSDSFLEEKGGAAVWMTSRVSPEYFTEHEEMKDLLAALYMALEDDRRSRGGLKLCPNPRTMDILQSLLSSKFLPPNSGKNPPPASLARGLKDLRQFLRAAQQHTFWMLYSELKMRNDRETEETPAQDKVYTMMRIQSLLDQSIILEMAARVPLQLDEAALALSKRENGSGFFLPPFCWQDGCGGLTTPEGLMHMPFYQKDKGIAKAFTGKGNMRGILTLLETAHESVLQVWKRQGLVFYEGVVGGGTLSNPSTKSASSNGKGEETSERVIEICPADEGKARVVVRNEKGETMPLSELVREAGLSSCPQPISASVGKEKESGEATERDSEKVRDNEDESGEREGNEKSNEVEADGHLTTAEGEECAATAE
uniref:peptidylprolyl isomerase n=1 Tax=Chromera velia CCMP2878 TaxID=1169474 RepID=A0A0G4GWR2_9ALVE|eukprot:Cvel_23715.t1-p1 / transcript=Cvel_23715.t1 / gene=Cvel_23715 / organism=Chromera_velia_CCMP2878 / gene_product=Peptidyl-prolyl cis-trans isomerase FKBP4, putative / transcript_product=Peptidyl-prolyl cis-trans isomerase FKBP4, putative / location=Cvel_scaffold2477:1371-6302(+) / protein_length=834 / sequence_SO=supercontig / SO=protein_coding / is_pseudo=false